MEIIKEPLIITDKNEMRQWSRTMRAQGKTIGLVPTMGYLHEGHLSLIKECHTHTHTHTHLIVVSIYVNPANWVRRTYEVNDIGNVLQALSIYLSLSKAKSDAERGRVNCRELKDSVIQAIHEAGGRIDYAEIVDQESLEALEEIKGAVVLCVAAWFGKIRL